jgi:acyl transferase domain-containing protein/acyl carrier protein
MNNTSHDIAVIGVGLKFSACDNMEEYWQVLNNSINCVSEFKEKRRQQVEEYGSNFAFKSGITKFLPGSYVETIDEFDHDYFKITPREASLMDPAQRLFLQTVIKTFEDAGYSANMLKKSRTGVFVGYTSCSFKDNYATDIVLTNPDLISYSLVGNMTPIIPSRVSHLLDLKGPTMVIDTACSSSLISIHEACQSIISGTCDMAIAGGIKIHLLPIESEYFRLGIESSDGMTRAFDSMADGSGIGEGIATVLLKPLKQAEEDMDHIYAVIKGSAVNGDGTALGLTAPNPGAQTQVILDAWKHSNVSPEKIDYIETHGTATVLGDPIEIQGLDRAFQKFTKRKQFCALGSVKTNLGHLFECAGMASFIKVLLAIQKGTIPPTLNFSVPNDKIDFLNTPFFINTKKKAWHTGDANLRVAGLSAFGLSGTNCHMVLSGYERKQKKSMYSDNGINSQSCLLTISAKSPYSLHKLVSLYYEYVKNNYAEIDIHQFCYQANLYRDAMKHRISIVGKDKKDLLQQLKIIMEEQSNSEQTFMVKEKGQYFSTPEQLVDKSELIKLKSSLTKKIDSILKSSIGLTDTDLKDISECFTNGGTINWNLFYSNAKYKKLSLPSYPFVPYHHWLPVKEVEENNMYYQKTWVSKDIVSKGDCAGQILVIDPYHSLSKDFYNQLASHCEKIIKTDIGNEVSKGFDYCLSSAGDYTEIFKKYNNIDRVLLACSLSFTNERDSSIDFNEILNKGLYVLLDLYKNLPKNYNIKISVLSDYAYEVDNSEECLKPENALLYGFGKCMKRESKAIKFSFIDIDKHTDNQIIVNEILSNDAAEIIVYRNSQRFIEGITEIDIKKYKRSEQYSVRDEGVYLITGGLGGIGFEAAKLLCQKGKNIRLVLLNRTILPERSQWNSLNKNSIEASTIEKIKRLHELENMAGSVEYYSCDVSNRQQVQNVIDKTIQKHGKINGIIHGAGVGGGSTIASLTKEELFNTIASKTFGTWTLEFCTRKYEIDFFIMFSSIATVFSGINLSAYIAANSYLDAFSTYYNRYRSGQATTINWATWSQTGMSVQHDFTIDTLFKTLKTSNGVQALSSILGTSLANVIAGELNIKSKIILMLKNYPIQLSDDISKKIKELSEEEKGKNTLISSSMEKEIRIRGGGNYTEIEKQIGKICCEILGYNEIGVNESFFELGADSITINHIYNKLNEAYPSMLDVTDMFSHPSIAQLTQFLASKENIDLRNEESNKIENEIQQNHNEKSNNTHKDIAVIGVGLNFPCANSLEDYWNILINGIDTVRSIPTTRSYDMKNHYRSLGMEEEKIKFRRCSYLDQINEFDFELFKISPHDAQLMDPVARLFLQCSWSAIEDSGYGGDMLEESKTGIFLGYSGNIANSYSRLMYESDMKLFAESLAINQVSMAASRIAYVKNLRGPSLVIDTACSSSLVAIHTACQQIRSGECDMALAGGASLFMMPLESELGVGYESPENKTRSFAKGAEGSALGEGVGVVLLKSLDAALEDKDNIYGVIKGSAINQDGSSAGIAAPNYLAQSEVIQKAWESSEIDPISISYIEAHGTGTHLGDTLEVKGIEHAFEQYTDKKQFCAVGTVKSNLGHLNEAAGMTGLIKLLLMLKHRQIPPTLHFIQPNENIDFCNSSLYISTKKQDWITTKGPLRAGISAFGMSGTNCHIVVEEPPATIRELLPDIDFQPLLLSAKSMESLKSMGWDLLYYLFEKKDSITVEQICSIMCRGRSHYKYRMAILVSSMEDLINKLQFTTCNTIENINKEWFFYGSHHIVPENKKNRDNGDITTFEKKALTHQAKELINQMGDIKHFGKIMWEQLLNLYIKGSEVPWGNLYRNNIQKIHLPTYSFVKNHVWIDYKNDCSNGPEGLFHIKRWEKETLVVNNINREKKVETVLIFHHPSENFTIIASSLKEHNVKVIEVFYKEGYEKNESQFFMDCTQDSMNRLFKELKVYEIDVILFTHAVYRGTVENTEQLKQRIELGFYHAISVVKGFAKAHLKNSIELVFLCRNAFSISGDEVDLQPESATVIGLGKAIEQEFPNILCRAIDIGDAWNTDQILNELLYSDRKPYLIGLRGGERFVEVLDEVVLNQAKEIIRRDGNYLITGGNSGIGLETAKFLSEKGCQNIILLSRSKFPKEEEWDSIASKDKDFSNKLRKLREIQEKGSRLYFYSGDVSDQVGMTEIINDIRKTIGKLNGIFHSAGITGAGFILRKERDNFQTILNPKVNGTWVLDQVTKADSLDFMMLYSSGVTYTGEAGQSDYIAANSYLDAYVDYRNNQGRKTFAINWVSWKETGMSVRYGINFDDITKVLPTKHGIYGLNSVLMGEKPRVMVGQYNLSQNSLNIILNGRYRIAQRFREELLAEQYKIGQDKKGSTSASSAPLENIQVSDKKLIIMPHSDISKANNGNFTHNVKLLGKNENTYSQVEEKLGNIYSMILGFKEIDVYDNFFEIGGDSIMLTKMHQRIDNEYPGIVTSADLFEFTSISSLAQYIQMQTEQHKNITNIMNSPPEIFFTDSKTGNSVPTYELSSAQKRIYIESKLHRNKTLYNNPFAFELEVPIGINKLKGCLQQIAMRHESLRTVFMLCDKALRQVIYDDVNVYIKNIEAASLEEVDFPDLLTEFDLSKLPLFQVTAINYSGGKQIILFDLHHIIADGFSSSILVRDIGELLQGRSLSKLPYQYRHYVQYQVEQMSLPTFINMQAYWAQRLENYHSKVYVAYDYEQGNKVRADGSTICREMDNKMEAKLILEAKKGETTIFSQLLIDLYLLLYFLSKEKDIVVGVPVLGRDNANLMEIVGMFVNTLPMRTVINDEMRLSSFVKMVSQQILSDIKNQSYPYDKMVEMKRKHGEDTNLFSIMFEYENESMNLHDASENKGKSYVIPLKNSKYDISVTICKKNEKLLTRLDYRTTLYSNESMSRLLEQYYKLMEEYSWDKWKNISLGEIGELIGF